jgi:hypothetical protein
MKNTVAVARTAYDLTHVNRLRVSEFSIVRLAVTAGGKSSKTYWPEWEYKQAAAGGGSDDFHFCPEKENAAIEYEIDDPFALVGDARFELFCRFEQKPLWTLELKRMGEDTWLHGKHSLKWDGRVVSPKRQAGAESGGVMGHDLTTQEADDGIHDDLPDGYITLEHTPYKLQLTLIDREEDDRIAVSWTYFQILVKKLEFEFGPVEAVPSAGLFAGDRHKMDKAVHAAVLAAGGVPASAAANPTRVPLVSNLYKYSHWFTKDTSEMEDNTAFDVYKGLWDDGPRLPVFALIRLADSNDAEVKLELGPGAKALGKTKFLWDWVNVREVPAATQSQAAPQAFLTTSIDYDVNVTEPKGTCCHVDRGGKRGPKAEPVFPEQGGYLPRATLEDAEFPFKVEECKTRKWAAFSYAWTKGTLIGRTGVLFRPSRMAGDAYKLAVYVAWDKTAADTYVLDKKDEPLQAPAPVMAETGTYEVWREIHIARYYRKQIPAIADFVAANLGAGIPAPAGSIRRPYNEAFVEVVDTMGGDNVQLPTVAATYNSEAEAAVDSVGDELIDARLMVATGANHAGTPSQFLIETFAAFTANVQAWFPMKYPLHPNPLLGAAAWMAGNGYAGAAGPANYGRDARYILLGPGEKMLKELDLLKDARDGVTIMHFQFEHQLDAVMVPAGTAAGSVINGMAADLPHSTRSRCCFIFWNTRVDTFVHEVGHHMFLPHSPYKAGGRVAPATAIVMPTDTVAGNVPGGSQVDRHDFVDTRCVMSYNPPRPAFCGLCQLRLRGWDAGPNDPVKANLKNTAANNKKP